MNLNNDEFDSLMDLIITIVFMAFGILATAFMCKYLSVRVEASDKTDKIMYTRENYELADTYSFTGYQAYMFSWCMDELSYVPLYWLGDSYAAVMTGSDLSNIDTDTESDKWVCLSTLTESGSVRPQFIPYRNRLIVGTGFAESKSVKSVINRSSGVDSKSHYLGTNGIKYKLLLTDTYKSVNDLGNHPTKGGKTFQWILLPQRAP